MKKQFTISGGRWIGLALMVIALCFLPIGQGLAQSTTAIISPSSREVDVGATTTVDIRIQNVTGLYGGEVHLTFDPAVLEVVDADTGAGGVQIQPGTFLQADFVAQNVVDQAAGKIDFAISQRPPNEAVSGSGVFATVTFQGKASGTSAISFVNTILSTQGAEAISHSTQNGSVVVSGVTATPTETLVPTDTPTPTDEPAPTDTPTPTDAPAATDTPTPTNTPTPKPTATPSGNILGNHTVRSGETLYCIARAYGVDPYAIAAQNGILNPNLIHPGQVLKIPNKPYTLPAGRTCPRQFNGDDDDKDCRWYHTVVAGENLYRIGLKYSVSMYTIAGANGITNMNLIYVGDVLCIP